MNILHIKTSPFGEHSKSNQLAETLLSRLGGTVETVDLNTEKIPHLTKEAILVSWGALPRENAPQEANEIDAIRLSNIEKIKKADTIVISYPVWDFSIPAVLKAYIDLVIYMGQTFKYGENGPVGLVDNIKKVYLVESSGSIEGTIPDHYGKYLTEIFAFWGIKNVERISFDGADTGTDEEKEARRTKALSTIQNLAI